MHPLRARPNRLLLALCVAAPLFAGCVTGSYTWVNEYKEPPLPPEKSTVIVVGDVISVRVYNQLDMSTKTRVRNDGKVSVPFLNDIDAAGYTPVALAKLIQTRLKEFINTPVVTVSLDDPRPNLITVTGEVNKPGVFALDPGAGVLAALASASGLSPFATWSRIFVLRQFPAPARIRFNYLDLQNGDPVSIKFQLRQGDAVVCE